MKEGFMDPQRKSGRAVCSNGFTSQEVTLQSYVPFSCTRARGSHLCAFPANETKWKKNCMKEKESLRAGGNKHPDVVLFVVSCCHRSVLGTAFGFLRLSVLFDMRCNLEFIKNLELLTCIHMRSPKHLHSGCDWGWLVSSVWKSRSWFNVFHVWLQCHHSGNRWRTFPARVWIVDFSLVGKKEALESDSYFESCCSTCMCIDIIFLWSAHL